MTAIITEKFRQHNANQFFESFSETAASKYFLFVGKSTPFTSVTSGGDDNTPPVPIDGVSNEFYNWDSMLAAKQITSSDISYVIPRRNWANSTTYDMYEHNISSTNTTTSGSATLWESSFYFITTELKVYKVLDNNGGTAYSGSEPTSTSVVPFGLGGYILQYMFTVSGSRAEKFLTNDFIPVETDSTVSAAAVDGSIDALKITPGSNYTAGTYYAAIKGDGTGGVVKIIADGGIAAFGSAATNTQIFSAGTGYTHGTVDLSAVFTDSALTTTTSIGGSADAVIQPIISPKGGHGFNSVTELGAHFVMMATKLEQAEGDDITVYNDFRELGIVVDPFVFGTTTVSTVSTARQTYAVTFPSASQDFLVDEKITQTTTSAVGRVVEWDATRKVLYYTQERYPEYGIPSSGNYVAFSGGNLITGATSNATATPYSSGTQSVQLAGGTTLSFSAGYANPELEPDSGNIVYAESRRPITRAADQSENIKIIVEF
tara:strand:- start:218 stop:1684 length:1467 start_codon:yes stop_codon:yes gene_type:complete